MTTSGLVVAAMLTVGALSVVIARLSRRHKRALGRLEAARDADPLLLAEAPPVRPRRLRGWWAVVLLALILVPWLLPLQLGLGIALAVLVLVLLRLVVDLLARYAVIRFETQLAEALDMVVSALRAGLGTVEAFERAAHEAHPPLAPHLHEIVERLRLGESARDAVGGLAAQRPLESVRLFAFALAAHMEGGGSLAPTLASVARATRDRVALDRRVLGQTAEAQASVTGVLLVTYGLAVALSAAHDSRLATFLASSLGVWFATAAVFLQAIGVVWMGRMARSGI